MNNEIERQELPKNSVEEPTPITNTVSTPDVPGQAQAENLLEHDENEAILKKKCEIADTADAPSPDEVESTAPPAAANTPREAAEESPAAPADKKTATSRKKTVIALTLKPIHIVIIALTALAVVAAGVWVGMNLEHWLRDPDLDPNAEKYPYPGTTNVAEGEIAIPGYSKIQFPADSTEAKMILPNPDNNPCYFVFSIVLADTDEVLYRSGMIPPGMAVTDLTLSRPLEAGEYAVVIRIECFSLEDKQPMNGANVNAVISAK